MNYHWKATILHSIDLLPAGLKESVYRFFQMRNGLVDEVPNNIPKVERSLSHFQLALENLNKSFADSSVLEIGTGFVPIASNLLLRDFGVRQVTTFDIKRRVINKAIDKVNKVLWGDSQSNHRLNPSITYRVHNHLPLNNHPNEFDFAFSRNVLEHIQPKTIVEMHQRLLNVLAPSGLICDQISPSDHRAFFDKNYRLHDFLKYTDEQWESMCTSFDYHNRLRLPEYIGLFERIGLRIVHLKYDSNKGSTLPEDINTRFKEFSVKELTAGNIRLILKKF